MVQGLPCPACGAPIKNAQEMLGSKVRCPSCGYPFQAAMLQGAITLTPIAVGATSPVPRRNHKQRIEWQTNLPILVAVASFAGLGSNHHPRSPRIKKATTIRPYEHKHSCNYESVERESAKPPARSLTRSSSSPSAAPADCRRPSAGRKSWARQSRCCP